MLILCLIYRVNELFFYSAFLANQDTQQFTLKSVPSFTHSHITLLDLSTKRIQVNQSIKT